MKTEFYFIDVKTEIYYDKFQKLSHNITHCDIFLMMLLKMSEFRSINIWMSMANPWQESML